MKTLTLLRHAKSGWDAPVQRDFERPLNAKGRRAAQTIGRHLKEQGCRFDHILASPAMRVQQTLTELGDSYGEVLEANWDRRVYLASAATLLDLVRELPDSAATALLVGHNPGLEDLVLMLVPSTAQGFRRAVEEKYPTASVAELSAEVEHWADLTEGGATFARFTRPRDLDATLGPDED